MKRIFKVLSHEWPETGYTEGLRTWHQAIDFGCLNVGETISAEELAKIHSIEPSYYDDVSELVNDGLIEIVEVNREV